MRASRAAAILTFVVAVQVCAACTENSDSARSVSVRQLWLQSDQYLGERVRTHGTLRIFEPGTNAAYLTLDDETYRIGVQGVSVQQAQPLLSKPVEAEGVLHTDPGFGIFIQVERIDIAPGTGP